MILGDSNPGRRPVSDLPAVSDIQTSARFQASEMSQDLRVQNGGRGTCTQCKHSFIYTQTEGRDVGEGKITFLCGWIGCKSFPETLRRLLSC